MDIVKCLIYVLVFPGVLFTLILSLFLAGIDRKLVARMQRRQGPPILQPLYDSLKLLGKDSIVPKSASRKLYLIAPFIGLASALSIPLFIPIYQNVFIPYSGDVILIIYLLTICGASLVLGGSSSGSHLAGIGASREVVTMIAYELPMVIAILSVCRKAGQILGIGSVYSMVGIQAAQSANGASISNWVLIPAALAFLMVIPAEVGVVPFDIAEAETEICEGPLVEYSGIYLAMYKITSNIKAFIMSGLFVALFLGGNGLAITESGIANCILNIVLYLVLVFVVMFITITLPRSVVGRLKINQALKFFWTIPTALSLISFILVTLQIG